jgi:hypothetical protein
LWALLFVAFCVLMFWLLSRPGSLVDALQRWWSGKSTENLMVYGFSMVWWGRFGKILQLFGGLTVILDIVGPERVKAAADNLRKHSENLTGGLKRLREEVPPLLILLSAVGGVVLVTVGSFVVSRRLPERTERSWVDFVAGIAILVVQLLAALIVALLLGFLLFGGLLLLGRLAEAILRGLAFLMLPKPNVRLRPGEVNTRSVTSTGGPENPGAHLKLIGFLLFLIGFHFDLLAS